MGSGSGAVQVFVDAKQAHTITCHMYRYTHDTFKNDRYVLTYVYLCNNIHHLLQSWFLILQNGGHQQVLLLICLKEVTFKILIYTYIMYIYIHTHVYIYSRYVCLKFQCPMFKRHHRFGHV